MHRSRAARRLGVTRPHRVKGSRCGGLEVDTCRVQTQVHPRGFDQVDVWLTAGTLILQRRSGCTTPQPSRIVTFTP